MGGFNPAWLSLLIALLVAGAQAWNLWLRHHDKQQQAQLETEAQFENRQPLAAQLASLRQAFDHERKEWSKKLSELTIHLISVDLSIKALETNHLSTMKDITRLDLDIRTIRRE